MKTKLKIVVSVAVMTLIGSSAIAQQSAELPKGYTDKLMPEAQIGMLMCEGVDGKMKACTGSLEETVLGIITNTPYVTLNKPSADSSSRFIFSAMVSASAGNVGKGDFLKAGADGKLVRTVDSVFAYAVALEDAASDKVIRVKVISKR